MVGRAKWATKGSKGVNTWREKWRINRDKYWLSEWRERREGGRGVEKKWSRIRELGTFKRGEASGGRNS